MRPRCLPSRHTFNKDLRVRLDVLEGLLRQDRLLFNSKIMPSSKTALGCVNAFRNFALRPIPDTELFRDVPTAATMRLWKHPIDALHYVLLHYDKAAYQRATLGGSCQKKSARRAKK